MLAFLAFQRALGNGGVISYSRCSCFERGRTMQAGVVSRYGDLENLEIKEVPVPEPAAGEVRVRIRAIGLNDTDYALITGKPLFVRLFTGLRRPKYPIP